MCLPDIQRRIKFRKENESNWLEGKVIKVHKTKATKSHECEILLPNDDIVCIDFSTNNYNWEYTEYECPLCPKSFKLHKGLNLHLSKAHNPSNDSNTVLYGEETVNEIMHCDLCDVKVFNKEELSSHKYNAHEKVLKSCIKIKEKLSEKNNTLKFQNSEKEKEDERIQQRIRFHELHDERSRNEKWLNSKQDDNEEEIFHAEVKEDEDNRKLCEEAKEKELQNFDEYEVFMEVEHSNQKVLGTRFVLTQKNDGTIKARLVTKWFQETDDLQTDSPTASRDTLKVFCTVAANEEWTVVGSDVRSAFLQADEVSREIFVEPPPERKKDGIVWKLLKPCYGLKDASRLWFDSASKYLHSLGMKESMTDSCLFYYHKNDKLQGLLLLHVDDMLSCGSSLFEKDIMINLRKKYTFGKISKNNFEYTGIFIFQNDKKEIFLNQNAFSKNMPLFSYTNQHCDNLLGKKENRYIRRTTGQLSWLASQTRPDLSFDAFYLSTKLNKATFKDAMDSVKSTKKAYERNVSLKFSKLGPIEKLHIELYPDASLGNIDSELKTKSMMGYFACISNDAMEMNPLNWKSKIIEKVAPDIKSAETLALEQALDDTIHLGNMLSELYFEDPNKFKIPITINKSSKSLFHSIFSRKGKFIISI